MSFYIQDPGFEEYLELRRRADEKLRARIAEKEAKKLEKDKAKLDNEEKLHDDVEVQQEIPKLNKTKLDLKGKSHAVEVQQDIPKLGKVKKIYQCELCNKTFCDGGALTRHKNKKKPCTTQKPICTICGKTFRDNYDLKRHLEDRKTSCAPIVDNVPPVVQKDEVKCEFCGKSYKNMKCLDKHQEKCKIKNNKKVFNAGKMQPGMEVLLEKVSELQKQINEMQNTQNSVTNNNIIINNINQNNKYTQNVNLNVRFERETLDHTGPDDIVTAFRHHDNAGVVSYITKKIHDHDGNRNVFMCSPNDTRVLILKEINGVKKWGVETINIVCQIFYKQARSLISKYDDILTKKYSYMLDRQKVDSTMEHIDSKISGEAFTKEDITTIVNTLCELEANF